MTIPTTSNYMKFEQGNNVFRILGAFSEGTAIQGIEYWTTREGKRVPVRLRKNPDGTVPAVPISELETNKFGDLDKPKYFWALPVWNYAEKQVQILEITQKGILKYIQTMIENPKWGDPREYDIIVFREGEGKDTTYTNSCNPKEKLPGEILDTYINTYINLSALFDGADPFLDPENK